MAYYFENVVIREAHTEDSIQTHILHLSSTSTHEQVNAALALGVLALNPINQDVIREAGAISPLVRLLGSTDVQVQVHAAGALANLAANHPANKDAIREGGGIVALVAVLQQQPDSRVQEYAGGALQNLVTGNALNESVIQKAYEIAVYIGYLAKPDDGTKVYNVMRLASFAEEDPANRDIIRELGGIPPLMALSKDADLDIKGQATQALSYLMTDNLENRRVIQDAIRSETGVGHNASLLAACWDGRRENISDEHTLSGSKDFNM